MAEMPIPRDGHEGLRNGVPPPILKKGPIFAVGSEHSAYRRARSNDVVLLRVPLNRTTLAQRGNGHLASYG